MILLTGSTPFHVEHPDTVEAGQVFTVTIRCVSSGCTGLSAGAPDTGPGISYSGSSTSSSVSIVNTPQGSTMQSQHTLTLRFLALQPGTWILGPLNLQAHGLGTHTVQAFRVVVSGTGTGASMPSQPPPSRRYSWITGELREDPGGRLYPGVPLMIDYYINTIYNITNVTYHWAGSDFGVITGIEELTVLNWERGDEPGVRKSPFLRLTFVPAGPGPVPLPRVSAQVTYAETFPFTAPKDYVESALVTVPVYPFPEPAPEGWNGSLFDSLHVSLEPTGFSRGQAGERMVRLTVTGPGSRFVREPSPITVHGNASLLRSAFSTGEGWKEWDFVVEPGDTGNVILGPDTLVWLDRRTASYRISVMEPCTVHVPLTPRMPREILIPSEERERTSVRVWLGVSLLALTMMTLGLLVHQHRRRFRHKPLEEAANLEELLNLFEGELSVLLAGKTGYLGYEALEDHLEQSNVETLLAKRILRFWKDLEQHLSGREPGGEAFSRFRETAVLLRKELKDRLAG